MSSAREDLSQETGRQDSAMAADEYMFFGAAGILWPALQIMICAFILPNLREDLHWYDPQVLCNCMVALLVPCANWILLHVSAENKEKSPWLLPLSGFACGISLVYTLIFLALTGIYDGAAITNFCLTALSCSPIWMLAINKFFKINSSVITFLSLVAMALGFLACFFFWGPAAVFPLLFYVLSVSAFSVFCLFAFGPLLALGTTLELTHRVTPQGSSDSALRSNHKLEITTVLGLVFGMVLALAPDSSWLIARMAAHKIGSYDFAGASAAARLCRATGVSDRIVDLKRDAFGAVLDIPALLFRNGGSISNADATYYRVTGDYCNSALSEDPIVDPPIKHKFPFSAYKEERQRQQLATAHIGAVIDGLTLENSSLSLSRSHGEAVVHAAWQLDFANQNKTAQEAKLEVLVPPHAVLSSAYIWMHDIKLKADIEPRQRAKEKYTNAVVVRRVDPLLITSTAPNKYLVQCYPVPVKGNLQIEVHFDYPAHYESNSKSIFLPVLASRNFKVSSRHFVHIEGEARDRSITNEDLLKDCRALSSSCDTLPAALTTGSVQCRFQSEKRKPLSELFIVIDGSKSMAAACAPVAAAIESINPKVPVHIIFASDEQTALSTKHLWYQPDWRDALKELKNCKYLGGPDNLPSLMQASILAAGKHDAGVFWIHGPQPFNYPAAPADQIAEFFSELKDSGIYVAEYEAVTGPNKIIQAMEDPLKAGRPLQIASVLRTGNIQEDVERQLNILLNEASFVGPKLSWQAKTASRDSFASHADADSLNKLCAADQVRRLITAGRLTQATNVACTAAIVSPVSGAVKIEDLQGVPSRSASELPPLFSVGLDGALAGQAHNRIDLAFKECVASLNRLNAQTNSFNVAPGTNVFIGSAPATFGVPSAINPNSPFGPVTAKSVVELPGLQQAEVTRGQKLAIASSSGAQLIEIGTLISRLVAGAFVMFLAIRSLRNRLTTWRSPQTVLLVSVCLIVIVFGESAGDLIMMVTR